MKILILQKSQCHMGEWYYIVQFKKQYATKAQGI